MRLGGVESTPAVLDSHCRENDRYYGDHDQADVADPAGEAAPIVRAHPPSTPVRRWGWCHRRYA